MFYFSKDITLDTVKLQSNTSIYHYGSIVALTCQTASRPLSQISWKKDGQPINSGGNIAISYSASATNGTISQSVLIINRLTLNNNGIYRCSGDYQLSGIVIQSVPIQISKCIRKQSVNKIIVIRCNLMRVSSS